MKVEIKTLYLGQIYYRIAVLIDGAVFRTYGATVGTVARARNQLCQYWSQNAVEVVASDIPEAADVRNGRAK